MVARALRPLVALLVTSAIAVGCGGSSRTDGAATDTEDAPSTLDAASVVRDFDPSEPGAIAALNEVALGSDAVSSLTPLLEDDDPITQWAALYVVAIQVTDHDAGAALVPLLDDDDPITRVVAAASLSGLGYPEALPILASGLTESATLPYRDPPRPIAELAREALEAYTGRQFDDADSWQSWLEKAAPLEWDGTSYVSG
ncbi:MAG: HEAT repeat domain-containing protein [Actinomycetota bacterium]|nr:HEAT repeat domain-containing protein [Actinomycetota bacterium]